MNRGKRSTALAEQQRQSAQQQDDRRAYDYEQRDPDAAITGIGRIRRFTKKSSNAALSSLMLANKISPALVMALIHEHEGFVKLTKAFDDLNKAATVAPIVEVAAPDISMSGEEIARLSDHDVLLTFGQMDVPFTVGERLKSEITEIISQDRIEHALFETGQHGPFGATFKRGSLMRDYMVRFDGQANQYGHDVFRVADVIDEMACDATEATCSLHVFHAQPRPEVGSRGIKVTQADPNAPTHMGVQVAISERAAEFKHS